MIRSDIKKYIFVTVNYNNHLYTLKYVESIRKLSAHSSAVEIIIVDNNSIPSDYHALEVAVKEVCGITLLRGEKNIGYFGGLNRGLDQIQDKFGKIIIVGNNDLEFEAGFLSHLEKIIYDDKTFALAPNVITANGYHQNPHCVHRVSAFRKLGYRIYFLNYYVGQFIYQMTQRYKRTRYPHNNNACEKQIYIYMGIGACYVLTEHFFEHCEKLDDRVFLWGEEALFAGQVAAAGGKILYDPSIIIYHNENTTVSKIPSRQSYKIQQRSFKIYSKYL